MVVTHPRDVPETVARFSLKNETPPVTGAWMPGDEVGCRKFFTTSDDHWFALEGGGTLHGVTVAYETWGELDATASNAVLVCHALTGDSHASGASGRGHPTAGWWDDMIGPGAPLDTDRWFVVCANVLGGCQGSTGPASVDPATGKPFGSSFPVVSIRDMVRAQNRLAQHLGIDRWMSVVGGSMGGMQALEWAAMYPNKLRSVVLIATAAAASAFQIAWSAVGRRAIAVDPRWRGGDYYDAEPGDGPHEGLGTARAIAQIHYRSGPVYEERFGRDLVEPLDKFSMGQRFEVERYLDYQGNKLIRRFDANSYLLLNKAMDLHDVGRGRGGIEAGLSRIQAPVHTVTISSDWLYPADQQDQIRDLLRARGHRCDHAVVESVHGHDGFLLESRTLGPIVNGFISDIEKNY
jgi:homoserine O-acetyltransferase